MWWSMYVLDACRSKHTWRFSLIPNLSCSTLPYQTTCKISMRLCLYLCTRPTLPHHMLHTYVHMLPHTPQPFGLKTTQRLPLHPCGDFMDSAAVATPANQPASRVLPSAHVASPSAHVAFPASSVLPACSIWRSAFHVWCSRT